MLDMFWVVLFVALTGAPFGQGLPLRSTPEAYPHDTSGESLLAAWGSGTGLYAAIPALALLLTAVGLLFGCTWCYRHKDCKPNEGAENQLFTASASHLTDGRRPQPPDSGFSEPVNNNISEDNNNGPISLREMQNIANNNATAYIVSENEERNRVSRESVVEFEPLPSGIRVVDPLERCADWFGGEDFPRNRLQYLREIGRGWFGRVVEGEIEDDAGTTSVAVKILNQNASLEDKARFLDEARVYRDVTHENVLAFIARCLQEDPWVLMFELCSMDLQQYLIHNRPKMAILNESGVPLQLMCDVASALSHLHSRGYLYGNICSSNVLVREAGSSSGPSGARAVLGSYAAAAPAHEYSAPESRAQPPLHTASSEVWALGTLVWEVCSWAAPVPAHQPPPPDLPCPYRNHLYQVMQLCWNPDAEARPTSMQVHALLNHLYTSHAQTHAETPQDDGYGSSDFEERWQRLKPNSIPKIDEHIALVHAPSTSMASHFTGSDQEFDNAPTTQDTLSVDMDTAVSRSSSIMSDKDPLSVQIKSDSLNNLHGSLEDVRNIYLTHNETAALECHQGNISFEEREKEQDRSDSSVDPWVKDLIAGSQDDVSYYRDVSDVIKNLDNILNSEKTSSSESSHQASPSRDNLSLDCKKDYPIQSSMVKSPGISNFKNILQMGFDDNEDEKEPCNDEEVDRDTIGTLSHSFERHSDTTSQHTLENLTPDTPIKDLDVVCTIESQNNAKQDDLVTKSEEIPPPSRQDIELPKENIDSSNSELPMESVVPLSSVREINEQLIVREDCVTPCDNLAEIRTQVETKSIEITMQNDQENHEETAATSAVKVIETYLVQIEAKDLNSVETIESKPNAILNNHVNEIAKNLVENEVIQPAIETVSKMVQEKVHETDILQNEGLPLTLDIRLETASKPQCLKEATSAMIEQERKVAEEVKSKHEEFKIELKEPTPPLQHSSEALKPEPVQINVFEVTQISENERDELIPNNLSEEELLAFSSNFSDMNLETSLPLTENSSLVLPTPPEIVQSDNIDRATNVNIKKADKTSACNETIPPPEIVQNITQEPVRSEEESNTEILDLALNGDSPRSEKATEQSNDSTSYMDLINYTNIKANDSEVPRDDIKNIIQSCLDKPNDDNTCSIIRNESTVYLDLPSVLKETHDLIQSEIVTSQFDCNDICASTPKGSECSADTLEAPTETSKSANLSDTKIPIKDDAVAVKEQKFIADLLSPFESPTKSHPTDTYDENSSVVLGPFENCATEYKEIKTEVEIPKEELLAFSSNFSEINLETPSPLRDGNFLMEVPDIPSEELQFDDVTSEKKEKTDNSDVTDQSATTKHVSPSTPPNSPGVYLASTSSQKYLVDIDLDPPGTQSYPPIETDSGLSSLQKEIDLNQIELQITTKLAMAENENNMNIEYSGPLTVEGLVSEDDAILRESDAIPEAFLAGNGGPVEDRSEGLLLDEECVKALRNELELKLPLAQVAGIEPACEPEWGELPPPPELVVSYGVGGALSPIAEETRHQLSAYENDAWLPSNRTESSESYPEPCNDSTAEVTDLPTGLIHSEHSTYTIQSKDPSVNDTYTLQKDIPTSRELTMSADSLNGSPYKKPTPTSPIDDRTYNKTDDEKLSNCEHISQVSPFLLSPTTDTSAPDSVDNATGVSTLSKTTLPTDAKHSKPSELSKATSIDSWCSNDTLYNVEENFDELVIDADIPRFDDKQELVKSASTETLTHNEEEKEVSHCSTYIVHDSKSDQSKTFSPDSITANDNYTYTKVKTEVTGTTPSAVTKSEINESKSEVNDSTKSQTKDLAYGTLPSYSNCSTEIVSGIDDPWKFPQPELVRRSSNTVPFTPPRLVEDIEPAQSSPQTIQPSAKKMDSIDLTCFQDETNGHKSESSESQILIDTDSPHNEYKAKMAPTGTSTPLSDLLVNDESVEVIPMKLPNESENAKSFINSVPNLQAFIQSAEMRPQDVTFNQNTAELLEGDTTICKNIIKDSINIDRTPNYSDFENSAVLKPQEVHSTERSSHNVESGMSLEDYRLFENSVRTLSRNSNKDDINVARTPNYSDFESSAALKPQEVHTTESSGHSVESGLSSGDFRLFENSVRTRPQDLSSIIDTNSLFLNSERKFSDLAINSNIDTANSQVNHSDLSSGEVSTNIENLAESHQPPYINFSMFVTDLDDEETEQPHSIIITEVHTSKDLTTKIEPKAEVTAKNKDEEESSNRTFDSHTILQNKMNHTYVSHESSLPAHERNENMEVKENLNSSFDTPLNASSAFKENAEEKESKITDIEPKVNGINQFDNLVAVKEISQKIEILTEPSAETDEKDLPNGSIADLINLDETICNGNGENFAIVNFIREPFEELVESNVDGDKSPKEPMTPNDDNSKEFAIEIETPQANTSQRMLKDEGEAEKEGTVNGVMDKLIATEDFLQNEKKFSTLDPFLPLLSDIRFTGPASEIMSTSFNQDSPTEPDSPECEQDNKTDTVADLVKEWDSDSESHDSNSSSGEFIWKDGDGRETPVVPSTYFDHQQKGSGGSNAPEGKRGSGGASEGSGDSGSGSEGDEVEFVPSSWDCRAAPSKSSLRSLEQQTPTDKKRVVFKRQKYHSVYEYPRELADVDTSPAYLPDLSTYCEWDPTSVEDAELGYGQLYGTPMDLYPLRAGISFGSDYDEDFFISSSARPFESLGLMSSSSQFFPGMHLKPSLVDRDVSDDITDDLPPPPSPLITALPQTKTPSLDFTTPDSGVEDITPGSTSTEEDFKTKKLPETELTQWKPIDSGSSSESVSPSSPGGEALGGLRHTRDKLKLDLPPSPHIPSPRHNRVFNFVLDKPKRHRIPDERPDESITPLVMTDETPVVTSTLPVKNDEEVTAPEPTFSTFGKKSPRNSDSDSPEQKIILTDEEIVEESTPAEVGKEENSVKVEAVKGEGTVLDSGDEDSGIESSSKATLERKTNVS